MRRGFAPIVLVVIFALIAIGTFYFVKINPTRPQNIVQISPSPTPWSTLDETANWETYSNKQFGFELKYPKSWVVSEVVRNQVDHRIYISQNKQEFSFDPFTPTDMTKVVILPRGAGTELGGEFAKSTIRLNEPAAAILESVLSDGTPWATFIHFKHVPQNWSSDGSVYAAVKINKLSEFCKEDRKLQESETLEGYSCSPREGYIGHYAYQGTIDAHDRQIIEAILSTFRFD